MYYPSESDWAWLAGVIDGEGHISMVERKGGHRLVRRLAITNTCLPLLTAVGYKFGGKIHPHTAPKPKHRQQFQWYAYGDLVRFILHGVLPYLIVKKEEAELYLAFDARVKPNPKWGRGKYQRLTQQEQEDRCNLLERVRVLRQRAWVVADVPPELLPESR